VNLLTSFLKKNGAPQASPASDRKAMAQAASLRAEQGRMPSAIAGANSEARRYKYLSRMLGVGFVVSCSTNCVLASAIFLMMPLKTIEPVFIQTADKSEQIIRVEAPSRTSSAINLIAEQQAREHVLFRHTIMRDIEELRRRWDIDGYMGTHTSEREYLRFKSETNRGLDEVIRNGVVRDVTVNRSTLLQPLSSTVATGLAQVEFTVVDKDSNDREFARQVLVADITFEFRDIDRRFDRRFDNPTGFSVTRYQLSIKSN
jgi:type IV secretory pathway component VirB8